MYQKILVPLDGSKLAECVLPQVEAIAQTCELVDIVLARVVTPAQPVVGDYVIKADSVAQADALAEAEAESYLEKIAPTLHAQSAHVTTKVLFGHDGETLADFAAKEGFDLTVIATHGRSGLSKLVWGSVADKVLRSACVPVLMVRAPGCGLEN